MQEIFSINLFSFQDAFKSRVTQVQVSDSPYLQVKASSIAISSVLLKSMQMKEAHQSKGLAKAKSSGSMSKLSIFKNPRMTTAGPTPSLKSNNVVYNGIGGTTKVLQSDLKQSNPLNDFRPASSKTIMSKKKKLSPTALQK